jgi:hypothetical protein
MGRRHLGPRHLVNAFVPIPVRDALDKIARRADTDRSTVLADLSCFMVGMPELARILRFDTGQHELVVGNTCAGAGPWGEHLVVTRVPIPVLDAFDDLARRARTDRKAVLADLACCAVGLPGFARRMRFDAQVCRSFSAGDADQGVLPLAM